MQFCGKSVSESSVKIIASLSESSTLYVGIVLLNAFAKV